MNFRELLETELLEITSNAKEAIKYIKKGIAYVKKEDYYGLSADDDVWSSGIHEYLDPDMPFTDSFDEVVAGDQIDNMSYKEKKKFKADMISWLEDCIYMAKQDK